MGAVTHSRAIAGISPRSKATQRHLVAVVAFDGVVLTDFAIPCDVFGGARLPDGRAPYQVQVCTVEPTVTSTGVQLTGAAPLTLLRRADTIVIPGFNDIDAPISEPLVHELRRALSRGARVASICGGAFILARTGALDGRRATTHWNVAAELQRRFPAITVDPNVLYVDGDRVLTSAGVAAGFDLCLHLVRRDCGAEVAARVARMVVMPLERAGGQAQFIVHEQPDVADATFGPLLVWIQQHLGRDLSLPALAARASMSGRTLSRRFRAHVGMTPAAWVGKARVREAQRLLETSKLSVEAIAERVGYGSTTVLRERFTAAVGLSPLAYRRAFSLRTRTRPAAAPSSVAERRASRERLQRSAPAASLHF
jgi:transcriptional regulator GlxA family with amidase domain